MESPLDKIRWPLTLAALILCALLYGGCALFNNQPVISSLTAEKDWVTPSSSSKVECAASDPDDDSLDDFNRATLT